MRAHVSSIFILILLILWPGSLQAQSEALREASRQGHALYESGRYDEAIPFLTRAVKLSVQEFGPDHPKVAFAVNKLARLYTKLGRYIEAEPLLNRALAIEENALGLDDLFVAATLNNLAELYQAQGRYAVAEPLFKRALAVFEKALGPDHDIVATALNNLGLLYVVQARRGNAFNGALTSRPVTARHRSGSGGSTDLSSGASHCRTP